MKENSLEGVRLLKNLGIKVYMITGDNHRSARAIAGKADIAEVLSEVLPKEKADEVKKLQDEGHVVERKSIGIKKTCPAKDGSCDHDGRYRNVETSGHEK